MFCHMVMWVHSFAGKGFLQRQSGSVWHHREGEGKGHKDQDRYNLRGHLDMVVDMLLQIVPDQAWYGQCGRFGATS